jgi:iron complex transport system ATP-binding protein
MSEGGALLTAEGLGVRVGTQQVCEALQLQVRAGESWALLGPNGAGKTTLLHTLAGLRPPAAGQIRVRDRELAAWPPRRLARCLGVLFQQVEAGFPARVLETVLTGRHPHLGRWGWEGAADLALARRALAEVGLAQLEQRFLDTLSGGERQRVALAALLTQDPVCALLDEPGNHLDVGRQIQLLGLLRRRFTAPGRAMLAVLHDPTLALRFCDHVLLLFGDGRWIAGPAAEIATTARLSELYGHPLRRFEAPQGPVFAPA